jgi:hypothetical protein
VVTGARVAGFSVCTILGLLDGLGVEAGGVGSCVGCPVGIRDGGGVGRAVGGREGNGVGGGVG